MTTTAKGPDEIRADIEATRAAMQHDADRLTEKVSPGKVLGRQLDNAKSAAAGAKDAILGSAHSATDHLSDLVPSAPGGASAKDKVAGNPLVAGAVAFGVGYLLSSLLPSSASEAQVVHHLTDPIKSALTEVADQVKGDLAPAAADAIDTVKQVAGDAASTVKDATTQAAADVKDTATTQADGVKGAAADSAARVQEAASPTT